MRLRPLFILLLVLLGPSSAQGLITYKSEAQVAGDYITLADLADLPPEWARKCGAVPVWSAPPPGEIYTLTEEFLRYRLEQLGLCALLRESALPAAIQVRQTGVLLRHEEVAKAFRQYIAEHSPYPARNLVIEVYPLPEPVILPPSQVSLQLLPGKNTKLLGPVTLELVVLHEGQPIKRLKITGQVRLKRQVVCAARALPAQTVLKEGDLQVLSREVSTQESEPFFESPAQLVGQVLARAVSPQEIITSRHLSAKPLIKRGDEVTVIVEHEGLEISTKGVAQEQGFIGKPIKLLNPKSKKEFQGLVVDAKTVRVQL